MSFNFVPASPVGEAAARVDAEQRQHRPDSLTVVGAHSRRGRGHLLISEGLVSFHPRRGPEFVHTGRDLQLTPSGLLVRVVLDDGTQRQTVTVPRWRLAHLRRALLAGGVAVT